MKRALAISLVLFGCSKPSSHAAAVDTSQLGPSPVVSNAPPMPTGGRHVAPWPDSPPSKFPVESCGDCVRLPGLGGPADTHPVTDARLGTVVGIDPVDAKHQRAQIRVTGSFAPLATDRFESVVVAEPDEIIPTAVGPARLIDVRVVSPATARDRAWYAYAVVQPIDPDWKEPARAHVFVTQRGSATLGGWSIHLDELRASLTGEAATLSARGSSELNFSVQATTVFELDGRRYEVVAVQPAVDQKIGWVEIDALPKRP